MLPELLNIRTAYPFIYALTGTLTVSDSASIDLISSLILRQKIIKQTKFKHSIRNLCIFLHCDVQPTAAVTSFSRDAFIIQFSPRELGTTTITRHGLFLYNDRIDKKNSFILFATDISNSEQSCSLLLLPETIKIIPAGLSLKISRQKINATASATDLLQDVYTWPFNTINFIDGYNTSVTAADDAVMIVGGGGLGAGYLSRALIETELEINKVEESDNPGVININGQNGDIIFLNTQSVVMLQTLILTNSTEHTIILLIKRAD